MSLINKIKKYFEPEKSPEERRREAELNYRMQTRAFQRYDVELGRTIDKFKKIIIDSETSGQHANALRAVRFYRQLNATRDKVASVRMHFEMLHSMASVGDVMLKFMDSCKALGCDLSEQINLEALGTGEMALEGGLEKLNFLSDKLEQAFDTISDSLDSMSGDTGYVTAADKEALASIMGTVKSEEAPAEKAPAQKTASKGRHAEKAAEPAAESEAEAHANVKVLQDLMNEFNSIKS